VFAAVCSPSTWRDRPVAWRAVARQFKISAIDGSSGAWPDEAGPSKDSAVS